MGFDASCFVPLRGNMGMAQIFSPEWDASSKTGYQVTVVFFFWLTIMEGRENF